MQNNNKNIDDFFKNKANEHLADNSLAALDFDTISASLPTAASAPTIQPKTNPTKLFYTKIIVSFSVIVAIIATFYFTKKQDTSTTNNINPNTINTSIKNETYDTGIVQTYADTALLVINNTILPKENSTTDNKKQEIIFNEKIKLVDKNEDKKSIETFFEGLKNSTQVFSINTNRDTFIVCKNKTKLLIRSNCFTTLNKATVNGIIQLEIKEAYTYTDIIANGLHTTSNSNLLETAGMVFINASQDKNALDIDINKPIELGIPFNYVKPEMQLFYLNKNANNDVINNNTTWIANGQIQQKNKPINKKPVNEEDGIDNISEVRTTSFDKNFLAEEKLYRFAIRNFGWINCDRFSNYKNKTDISIELQNDSSNTRGLLIFPKIKSVINLININNIFVQYSLPEGEEAYFVAFKTTNGKVFTNIQKITIKKDIIKADTFKNIPLNQVKAILDEIGTVE